MVSRGVVIRFRSSLDYAIELQIRHSKNKWNVEYFGREAVAHYGDVKKSGRHFDEIEIFLMGLREYIDYIAATSSTPPSRCRTRRAFC